MLRSIAASLAIAATPRELHIYGLDFASRGLQALEALPHCGSVIAGDDEERVVRLLNRLQRVMAQRRGAVAAGGGGGVAGDRPRPPTQPGARLLLPLAGHPAFASGVEGRGFGGAPGPV